MKYPYFDYVWVASDSDGSVAGFVTAGEGPIPLTVMKLEDNRLPLLERRMHALPPRGEGRMLQSYPRPDSFLALAARGAFVYDWTDVHKTIANSTSAYELVCTPSNALEINDLPDQLRRIALATTLTGVRFGEEVALDVRKFLECIEPPPRGTGGRK
jgi:hypothetical protein